MRKRIGRALLWFIDGARDSDGAAVGLADKLLKFAQAIPPRSTGPQAGDSSYRLGPHVSPQLDHGARGPFFSVGTLNATPAFDRREADELAKDCAAYTAARFRSKGMGFVACAVSVADAKGVCAKGSAVIGDADIGT